MWFLCVLCIIQVLDLHINKYNLHTIVPLYSILPDEDLVLVMWCTHTQLLSHCGQCTCS